MLKNIVIVSIFLLTACDNSPQAVILLPPLVKVVEVSLPDQQASLAFPAVAVAADKASLSFRLQGEVTTILVRPGDHVTQGQLLAKLDPIYFRLEVDDARAQYNIANSRYRRSAKLVDKGYIAASQFDELKAQRRIAKARLDIARLRLGFTELIAPYTGVISHVPIKQFENVQVGQAVMNIHRVDTVDIQLQAPDSIYSKNSAIDVEKVDPISRVILTDGSEFSARLKQFTTEPDPELGSFVVTLTMNMPADRFILDGMAVEVRADAKTLNIYQHDQPLIPFAAIINEDGDSLDQTEKFVWVVNQDNTVSKRKIVVARVANAGVRLASGLAISELVVVAGGNRLRDGQQIRIFEPVTDNPEAD